MSRNNSRIFYDFIVTQQLRNVGSHHTPFGKNKSNPWICFGFIPKIDNRQYYYLRPFSSFRPKISHLWFKFRIIHVFMLNLMSAVRCPPELPLFTVIVSYLYFRSAFRVHTHAYCNESISFISICTSEEDGYEESCKNVWVSVTSIWLLERKRQFQAFPKLTFCSLLLAVHHLNMNDSRLDEHLSCAESIIPLQGLSLCSFAAVTGNAVMLWLFYKNESLRIISNRFLASLSVADF